MLKITKTLLRKVIKDVIPDPKAPGPFRIIADVGDCGYYDQRAVEAIKSGDRVLAIQLLLLSQANDFDGSDRPVAKGATKDKSDAGDYNGQGEVKDLRRPNECTSDLCP